MARAADVRGTGMVDTGRMSQTALASFDMRPIGRTRGLRTLTRALDAVVEAYDDPAVVAQRVGLVLRSALANPDLLEARHQEPWVRRYRPHLVHVHPEGRYSIVALVWQPGQATPIHDHRCWCVVGVWRGRERETTYDVYCDGDKPYLVERATAVYRPGSVSVLVPPDEDVHRVENAGDRLAISLHVYGDDISVHGSSINHTFADELVRSGPGVTDLRASWRALDAESPLAA
jgi:predicted metal-dependent enzyme (double-stranded beta helix superfamily)